MNWCSFGKYFLYDVRKKVSRLSDGIVDCGEGFDPAIDEFPEAIVGEPAIEEPNSVCEQGEPGFDEGPFPHVSRRKSQRSRSSSTQLY